MPVNRALALASFFALLLALVASLPAPDASVFPPGRALLLTAHPDDETMFFAPAVQALVQRDLYVVTVSNGDADGLGAQREAELFHAYHELGVDAEHITLLDHPALRDGMNTSWAPELVRDLVQPMIDQHNISIILTFDKTGVSGHPNHIALAHASLLLEAAAPPSKTSPVAASSLQIYHLVSHPLLTKYLSFAPLVASRYSSGASKVPEGIQGFVGANAKELVDVSTDWRGYLEAVRAMRRHDSQLVWFRWIYLAFSRYMWETTFEKVR